MPVVYFNKNDTPFLKARFPKPDTRAIAKETMCHTLARQRTKKKMPSIKLDI